MTCLTHGQQGFQDLQHQPEGLLIWAFMLLRLASSQLMCPVLPAAPAMHGIAVRGNVLNLYLVSIPYAIQAAWCLAARLLLVLLAM